MYISDAVLTVVVSSVTLFRGEDVVFLHEIQHRGINRRTTPVFCAIFWNGFELPDFRVANKRLFSPPYMPHAFHHKLHEAKESTLRLFVVSNLLEKKGALEAFFGVESPTPGLATPLAVCALGLWKPSRGGGGWGGVPSPRALYSCG